MTSGLVNGLVLIVFAGKIEEANGLDFTTLYDLLVLNVKFGISYIDYV